LTGAPGENVRNNWLALSFEAGRDGHWLSASRGRSKLWEESVLTVESVLGVKTKTVASDAEILEKVGDRIKKKGGKRRIATSQKVEKKSRERKKIRDG